MECTSESLGAVLRAFCPCGLVRQALNYILRGVRIGADRVKITLFLRGAERVHVPTLYLKFRRSGPVSFWRGGPKNSGAPLTTPPTPPPLRLDPYIYQSIALNARILNIYIFFNRFDTCRPKVMLPTPPGT
jgi:hypothetical protein